MSAYPTRRLRRLRQSPTIRRLRRETRLCPADLILPLFVVEAEASAGEIPSMPGVLRYTVSELDRQVEKLSAAGIQAVLLFGIPESRDPQAGAAAAEDGIVPQALRCIKSANPEVVVITDVCLCSYTSHGHCGVVRDQRVLNDESLEILSRVAVAHARAGADLVAPSAMLDGMVAALRRALDADGYAETAILSYAVKYASSFYGPFREAAECAPQFGDRRTYQMDPANAAEALAEARLDLEEGADLLMVKPGLPYLDVIRLIKERFAEVPLAAYQVSGEYAMIKAAAERGWLDEDAVLLESATALKRAGADLIISYYAPRIAEHCRTNQPD